MLENIPSNSMIPLSSVYADAIISSLAIYRRNGMRSIAVYCGSSDRIAKKYLDAAYELGSLLASRGHRVVYGAGSTGMMGAVARGAMARGGEVIGVMPEIFDTPELRLTETTEYIIKPDMHSRLAYIIEISDGFIALPGGFGTLDEFFQTVTWAQIGLHGKPIGLLNIDGYYDKLHQFLQQVEAEGFMYAGHNGLYACESDPEALLAAMENYRPPEDLAQWVERGE
jgi:uncharacterized protein (TIGR00730 family)